LQQKLRTRRGAASIDGYFSNLLGQRFGLAYKAPPGLRADAQNRTTAG
jgi:hypothetical protein